MQPSATLSRKFHPDLTLPLLKLKVNQHPFFEEFFKVFRLYDSQKSYQNLSNESLLNSLIQSKGASQKDVSLSALLFGAFYRTIAQEIQKKTGHVPEIFINLNERGSSSALIFCGNLLVVYELVERVSSFGFDSLEKLVNAVEQKIYNAVTRVYQFF